MDRQQAFRGLLSWYVSLLPDDLRMVEKSKPSRISAIK